MHLNGTSASSVSIDVEGRFGGGEGKRSWWTRELHDGAALVDAGGNFGWDGILT